MVLDPFFLFLLIHFALVSDVIARWLQYYLRTDMHEYFQDNLNQQANLRWSGCHK